MREEDFVLAARLDGESEWAIIVRYMIPGFASYIIVSLTWSLPGMILGETALSFLGIGLNPRARVTGNMLEDEKILGTCHFAIGSNYDDDAEAFIHLDCLVNKPTITVARGATPLTGVPLMSSPTTATIHCSTASSIPALRLLSS